MTTTAILTAAGSGSRLGANLPKALVPINGKPIVQIAAENLAASGVIDNIIVTVPDGYMDSFRAALSTVELPVSFVVGGRSRQDSIWEALQQLSENCNTVLVHDAARPFTPPMLIAEIAKEISDNQYGGAIPALPVTDTIKFVNARGNVFTPDRKEIRAVQTPQGFEATLFLKLYRQALEKGIRVTDDSGILEASNWSPKIIQGSEQAMKITTPTDLRIATLLYGDNV